MLESSLGFFIRLLHGPAIFDYSRIQEVACERYWSILTTSLLFVYCAILIILLFFRQYFRFLPHWLNELFEMMLGKREISPEAVRSGSMICIAVAVVIFFPLSYILAWIIFFFAWILGGPMPYS